MSKYTWIDRDICIACAGCYAAAPAIYGADDNGYAEVIFNGDSNRGIMEIPSYLYEDLQDAYDGCPTLAVKVANHPFNK
ncbi:ferredoxin [Paenibacillus septentrionalis]|uniref:Ferredoxin n=1 Tax=Paenibacillus septentrionalis TaxID=429342 RepID=A0ABW1UZ04_9BACL